MSYRGPRPPVVLGSKVKALHDRPGYAVTDAGDVWSCRKSGRHTRDRFGAEWHKLASASILGRAGHRREVVNIPVANGSRRMNHYVYRLVLEAFVGPCRWGTHRSNQAEMVEHGHTRKGQTNLRAKLADADVVAIRARRANGERPTVLAREFGITYRHLWAIVESKRWRHLTDTPQQS